MILNCENKVKISLPFNVFFNSVVETNKTIDTVEDVNANGRKIRFS